MALDQKKFAFLTGAIAASIVVVGATSTGCTINEVKSDDKDDENSSSSSSGGESSSSSGGESSSSGGGGSSSGGESSSSGGGSSSGGEACLGDEGDVPSCEGLTGCIGEEANAYQCTGYGEVFRPAVARQLVECLQTAPTCEEGDDGGDCAKDAVAAACAVDVDAYCAGLSEICPDAARADIVAACKALAPALTETGKAGLTSCLTNIIEDVEDCDLDQIACFDPSYASSQLVEVPFEE